MVEAQQDEVVSNYGERPYATWKVEGGIDNLHLLHIRMCWRCSHDGKRVAIVKEGARLSRAISHG